MRTQLFDRFDVSVQAQRVRQALAGHHCPTPSVTCKLPFPYYWIPGDLRVVLARILFRKTLAKLTKEERDPRTYADNRTDLLCLSAFGRRDLYSWRWPDGKRCALVLSHDVDTARQESGIELLARVAEDRGIRSTFSFVGKNLASYRSLLRRLRSAGHEIALHDRYHDNQVAFLAEDAIVKRLTPLKEQMAEHGIEGFRSPSWYTSPQLWRALKRMGFSYDMSVVDSWPFFDRSRNFGVASIFPFRYGGLTIVPNTIPYDGPPRMCGYRVGEILTFWKPKLDWIGRNGGLIMLNVHPDRWWSGTAKAAAMLGKVVDYVMQNYNPAVMRARDVSAQVASESARGATVILTGEPDLEIPIHGTIKMTDAKHVRNPFFLRREDFLKTNRGD